MSHVVCEYGKYEVHGEEYWKLRQEEVSFICVVARGCQVRGL